MNINRSKRSVLATICIAIASFVVIGSTLAFIVATTGILNNIFSPGEVAIEYSDSKVTNTGDADVYLRMTYVVTLVRSDDPDIYLGSQPFSEDNYTVVEGALPTDWKGGADGIYYYTQVLEKGASIGTMPTVTATANDGYTIPSGYTLKVQYLFSAIQANPTDAVIEAWGGSVDANGTYTPGT